MIGVHRESLIGSYVKNQVAYLKTIHPTKSEQELEYFVKDVVRNKINRRKVSLISHPSPGNTELVDVDLLTHIKEHNHRIIAPCGTIYKSTDEEVAFDKRFIDMLRNNRDIAKKRMLKFAAEGKEHEKLLEDFVQALCKILVNSIIGSNGNDKNAMYDLEAFNGVTSMARHGIIAAYTYVERFLTANFYFPNIEHVINYIITTKEYCPPKEEFLNLCNKYNMVLPLANEVADVLCSSLNKYDKHTALNYRKINSLLEKLPQHELAFVYYSRNLYTLFTTNDVFWKNWIKDFLDTRYQIDPNNCSDIEPQEIRKIDGDLLQVMATVHTDLLNGIQIKKVADENPSLASYLAKIGICMQQKLNDIEDLLNTFLHNEAFVAHIHSQRNIIRKCAAVSDTDSVIFTTVHLVSWYLDNKFKFNQTAYNINAFIVYLLTKSIGSFITKMSISRGATGDNVKMIELKNEYFYPVFIKTNLGKHYAGNITIQEGNVLPKPNTDIKGVSFLSSNLPKVTHDFIKKIIEDIQTQLLTSEDCKISLGDFIVEVYDYERKIYDSLTGGDFSYYTNIAIKPKEEYKRPEISIYFNYEFWQKVFSEKYGEIHIPTKVPIIPINYKKLRSEEYLSWLASTSPIIHENLTKYLKNLDKNKKITRIPLCETLATVPDELKPILELRPIIYRNMAPVQLALKSIGLDLGAAKKMPLLLDLYGCVTI